MRQTKKGNQWYFGMKAHIGVDAQSGLTHSLATTPANESDVVTAHALLHGARSVCGATRATKGWASARRTGTRRWRGRSR